MRKGQQPHRNKAHSALTLQARDNRCGACHQPVFPRTMTEVIFVEVSSSRVEVQVCEIAERTYSQGQSLQIIATGQEQASRLDDLLWSFRPESFVPHGLAHDRLDKSPFPVVITIRQERVPGVECLLMTDYCSIELVGQFSRVFHLVVVDRQDRLVGSRRYWSQLREAGFTLIHQKA